MRLYGLLPLRVHGTNIEVKEGVDAVYMIRRLEDLQNRDSKLLLVQEKAAYDPAYTFHLTKKQHSTIHARQVLFKNRAYFYGFFCVKDFYELFQVFVRTIFVEAGRMPQFNTATRSIHGWLPGYMVFGSSFGRTGYPFDEIFRRFARCYIGLPNRYFRMLTEDLYRLLEKRIPFHLLTYDIKKDIIEVMSPQRLEQTNMDEDF